MCPEKLCNSLMWDGAIGIKKLMLRKEKHLPCQVCQPKNFSFCESRWGKNSKNQMVYIFIINTVHLEGSVELQWPDRWEMPVVSEPLAGVSMENGKQEKSIVLKNCCGRRQRTACKIEVVKVFTTSSSFNGVFKRHDIVRCVFFFRTCGLGMSLKSHFHILCATLYSETWVHTLWLESFAGRA